jgi:PBP1b-binding outer membrane lipoprotein LpoB
MKKRILALLSLTVVFLLSSCASVSKVSTSQFRTTMGLDPQDIEETSSQMAQSMLAAHVLTAKGAEGRSVIVISTFRNNTALYDFDPNLIFNPIRVTLNKSGVAYCYVTNDAFVSRNRAAVSHENSVRDFLGEGGHVSSGPSPQYSITLELIENAGYSGNTTQKQYQIHMTLNKIGSGLSIWEDLKPVNKIGRRAAIGF